MFYFHANVDTFCFTFVCAFPHMCVALSHSQGGSVPWNAEVTNTDPSNFLWEKNSTAVVTVAPGMPMFCS
jgi:hypothetical protein